MNPRIVHLLCPKGTGEKPVYSALSIMNDRFAACVYGNDLHVVDLHADKPTVPIWVVQNGKNFVATNNTLVTYDDEHHFRRFIFDGHQFVQETQFALTERPHPWPGALTLSPSGRFLVIEVPPLPGEKTSRVVLLDARDGRVLATYPCILSARASFVRLDGAEKLFLSAPDYMSVTLVDPESGSVLHSFHATNSWDFCHTDYELSDDGSRLLAFGCVWAAPYEARLYDATPWTRGNSPSSEGFPLPLMYRQYEDLECETVFVPHFTKNADGLLDVMGSVSLRELRQLDAEALQELREGLSEMNGSILDEALRMEGNVALLQRRVDPVSGQVRSYKLAPAHTLRETHVYALPEHQVLILDDTMQWFDGQTMHDVGSFAVPKSYYCSAVTSDGGIIVVRELID